MSNIVVFVNYKIKPDCRATYLDLMKEIKLNIMATTDIVYNVLESKHKDNCFTEVFECPTRFSFNNFNKLTETSSRLNHLLKELDKCILNYTHVSKKKSKAA
jgi:hypothetical protein